jgi:hypothetical protein
LYFSGIDIMKASKYNTSLYETDYLKWLNNTIQQIQDQDYDHIDWQNLIEEIEDMGRNERRALESNLIIVFLHLLKWQYQPQKRTGSWERSLIEHRRRIRRALKESPSLNSYLEEILLESYTEAVKQAKAETKLPISTFPPECPYQLSTIIDDDFLPS